MKIVIINRKGGVSKSTLSLLMMRELNYSGTPTDLICMDVLHSDKRDEANIKNNPSNNDIDAILASKRTSIFDTGGVITSTTDALAEASLLL